MLLFIFVVKDMLLLLVFGFGEFICGEFIGGGGFLGLGGLCGLCFFFCICFLGLMCIKFNMLFLGGFVSVLLFILISDCIRKNNFNVIVSDIINVIKNCDMVYVCLWFLCGD